MITTTVWLMLSGLFYSLQLSTGSFPKPLTPQEEQDYLEKAAQGDLEARNVLIVRNLRLVAHIMKKYYAQGADQEDLISIGTIGLIKGISTFDPSKGARLATYAARCVENATLSPTSLTARPLHPKAKKRPDWRILDRISGDFYVLARTQNSHVRYAPIYIHSFPLCAPRRLLESQMLFKKYYRYADIDNVPDRLRWCRHSKGLMQVEVAEIAGVSRASYIDIECGITQHIPAPMMEKLADFYGVPITDFMDEFNRFLYDGQANRIRAYRKSMGLGKKPFARATGIPIRCLQEWETERKQISRRSWEKYFKKI